MIIPKYITSLFYGALVEAVASENGARMQAMDSATSNAEEMISDLTLKFNLCTAGLYHAGADRDHCRCIRHLLDRQTE